MDIDSYHKDPAQEGTPQERLFEMEKIRSSLRQLMWNKAGIIRCEKSLVDAKRWLKKRDYIMEGRFQSRRESELKNMITVANLIIDSAILRKGSVGAHYRSDFRERGENWRRHTACRRGQGVKWI